MSDNEFQEKLDIAKRVPIVDVLSIKGVKCKRRGRHMFCSSIFSSDTVPSMCIYTDTNRFVDYSTGEKGDVIDLIQKSENASFLEAIEKLLYYYSNGNLELSPTQEFDKKKQSYEFVFDRYLIDSPMKSIKEYADSRRIESGYFQARYFIRDGESWKSIPSLGFPHIDDDGEVCGIRFRTLPYYVDKFDLPKCNSRGKLSWYFLDNRDIESFQEESLYIVESETSANSLHAYLVSIGKPCVVISFGGIHNSKEIPDSLKHIKDKKMFIDYDGDEEKYSRLINSAYISPGVEVVKMMLDKGEDFNSLHVKNKMNLINNLL